MMRRQDFTIPDSGWHITIYHDATPDRLGEVAASLLDAGESTRNVAEAISVLRIPNKGYTYTNYAGRVTVSIISYSTNACQRANTIEHELKHIVEHLSTYYGVDPKSEQAAYLQGYVGARLVTFAYNR